MVVPLNSRLESNKEEVTVPMVGEALSHACRPPSWSAFRRPRRRSPRCIRRTGASLFLFSSFLLLSSLELSDTTIYEP